MRKLLASLALSLLSLMLITNFTLAQSSANYTFSTTTTGSFASDLNSNPIDMSTGTTTIFSGYNDDNAGTVLSLGFDFYLMGNRYTQFAVSSNGLLSLSSTGSNITGTTYTVSSGTTTTPIISPFGGDNAVSSTGKIHYKIVGSAPNRTLVVAFDNMTLLYLASPGQADGSYQMRLYESSGRIEFVYGAMSRNAGTGAGNSQLIGIGFATNTTTNNLLAVTTSSNTSSVTSAFTQNTYTAGSGAIPNLNSGADGTKRTYVLTPPSVNPPTALNFTAVTSGGMTLNWTDASNELKYALFRSDDGGTVYNFVSLLAANTVSSAQSGLLPGTTFFWRIYAISEGGVSTVLQGSQATVAGASITSNGTGGGNWSLPATWAGGVVPGIADNVTIKDGDVVTVNQAATINSLTVGEGVSGTLNFDGTSRTLIVNTGITVAAGGTMNGGTANITHILNIGGSTATGLGTGNLTVNGTFDGYLAAGQGKFTITFFGLQNAAVSGSGTINFNNTNIINKGTTAASPSTTPPVLDIQRGYTVQGATALGFVTTHTAGTLKISGSFTQTNPVYAATSYTVPLNGGFWLNNSNFTVAGQNGSPTITGLLRLTAGTYNVGTATGNSVGFSSGSTIFVEGATANIQGRFGVASAANTVYYNQSSGTLNLDVNATGHASTTLASFDLGTSTSSVVIVSGGTVNLVQPGTGASGPRDVRGPTGVAPTFTGGTINAGISTTVTNFLFRFIGQIPADVVTNNTTNNKNIQSTGTIAIYGTLTVNTGTTYDCNGFTNQVIGSTVTNNGTILGTVASSRFDFVGTAAQVLSGTGSIGTASVPFQGTGVGIANYNNVTVNQPIYANRVNLFGGTFINSNNITLGNGVLTTTFIQRGGGSAAAGAFDAAPTFNLVTNQLAVSYFTASTATTTGFEIPASRNIGSLTVNNASGFGLILAGGNLNLVGGTTPTLTMTLGNIDLGGNTLTVGASATAIGAITNTAGVIMNGTLTRWFGTTASPTTIANSNGGHFPMGTGTTSVSTSINRNLWLSFSSATAFSTGGTISVSHSNASGITGIAGFDDGGYTVDTRTNMNWSVSTSGAVLTGTINARIQASSPGFAVGTLANLRMIRATDAVGTYSAGTNTAADPQVNRTGLDLTMLANTFYFGANSSDMSVLITWVGTTGNWSDAANWSSNPSLPGSGDNVSIAPGSAGVITVDGNYAINDITIGTNATVNLGSNTLTVNRDLSQSAGVLNLGSGILNVKRNFSRSGGTFTAGTSTTNFSGTAAAQTIDVSASGTTFNNVLFTGGGATFQKIFTAARTLTTTGDYTVETTAQLNLSAATSTTHTIAGNFTYSGVTGASNIGSLTMSLTGSGKTIDGSALLRPGAGKNSVNYTDRVSSNGIVDSRYIFIKGSESPNALEVVNARGIRFENSVNTATEKKPVIEIQKGQTENNDRKNNSEDVKAGNKDTKEAVIIVSEKPEAPKYYTYERMKSVIDELTAKQKHNERLVFELEDATIIRNAPDFKGGLSGIETATTTFEFNVTVALNALYTLNDAIAMNTGRTLTVLGRLNCGTNVVGGAGNITVTGASASNTAGVVGTANTSSAGFNNFTASGTINWTTGGATVGIVDYNAAGDQTINTTNHPASTYMMCSNSGTKTLDNNYTIVALSSTGSPGATAAASKGALTVNAGATFGDGGFAFTLPNSTTPYGNVIVMGGFSSLPGGKISWPQCYSSGLFVTNGVTFGDLQITFAGNANVLQDGAGGTATISARNMIFSGTGASTWTLSAQGTTNINVTGDVSFTTTADNGGFNGTTAKTSTVKVAGNIVSSATGGTQNIMGATGTNVLELNGSSAQTISVPISMTAVTFFTGSTLRVNNTAGVTITNNDPSACTFTVGASGGINELAGSITMGDADILGYSGTGSTFALNGGTITDVNWPVTNGPQNVTINTSGTLPGDRTVPGTFTLTNGILNTGAFTLTIGTSGSNTGSISRTGGAVRGNLKRWFGTSTTTNTLFPMDDNNGQYVPGQISFTGAPSGAGTVTGSFTSTGSGTNGLPIIPGISGSDSINTVSDAFWTFAAGDGLTGGTYSIDLTGTNFPGVTDFTLLALLKRNDSSSPWTWSAANHSITTGSNTVPVIHGTGFTSFSNFALGGGGQGQNPLPVELSSFTSSVSVQNVLLKWTTTHEENNSGFDIERAEKKGTTLTWSKVGHVAGSGNSNNTVDYSYTDRKVQTGKYAYRLKQLDYNGNYNYYQLANEIEIGVPKEFALSQNYPNPFNPTTKIDFSLPFDSKVDIRIYDMTGREMMTLENSTMTAGYHTVLMNASALSSGTYFYRIIANGGNQQFVKTLKMQLIK